MIPGVVLALGILKAYWMVLRKHWEFQTIRPKPLLPNKMLITWPPLIFLEMQSEAWPDLLDASLYKTLRDIKAYMDLSCVMTLHLELNSAVGVGNREI